MFVRGVFLRDFLRYPPFLPDMWGFWGKTLQKRVKNRFPKVANRRKGGVLDISVVPKAGQIFTHEKCPQKVKKQRKNIIYNREKSRNLERN